MPTALRSDYDAGQLRAAARQSYDAGQTRRLLALAAIYDGATRTEAAAIGGVTFQIVRDWVVKLNERGPDGRPETRVAGGLALPWCNTEAMSLHLAEISARVTPGKHCALLVDQAGWHISERLALLWHFRL